MPCRVCHSTDTSPLPFEVPPNEGSWVRCNVCGSDSNSSDYNYALYSGDFASRHRSNIGGPEVAAREVSGNCEWFASHRKLGGADFLDVGCADGASLGLMATLGWSVHGFDVASPDYGGPHVTVAPLFNRWLFPRRFDAVLCREVLEHVECPRLLLAELHGVTRPDGLVQVQTPKACDQYFGHVYQSPHLFVLSVPQLLRMLDEAMLDVVESKEWDSGQAYLCRVRGAVRAKPRQIPAPQVSTTVDTCRHLGEPTGETVSCPSCRGNVQLKLFSCGVYGECTQGKGVAGVACCAGMMQNGKRCPCPGYEAVTPNPRDGHNEVTSRSHQGHNVRRDLCWAYGVTTVPARRYDLLPRTLASLARAGFDKPRLFIDGEKDVLSWEQAFGLEVTCRFPNVRTAGNWILSMWELYLRDPLADRYAIFQDDFVTYPNLRQYLDACHYPEKGYWNLYTFPSNQKIAPPGGGWFEAADLGGNDPRGLQTGRGAVALVFSREAVITLLSQRHLLDRAPDKRKGWRSIDGGIVTAMNTAGYREWVHSPSLTQHVGEVSVTNADKPPHPIAESWRGENFDALQLIGGTK